MTQWDALDEYDRAWALALDVTTAEAEAGVCPSCGGSKAECQDPDNQHAYVVSTSRCYRTAAIAAAQRKRTDHDGVLYRVVLDPGLKKSARKGRTSG